MRRSPAPRAAVLFAALALGGCSERAESRTEPAEAGRAAHAFESRGPEVDCAGCHPQHVAEWQISPHAYAMKDPVFIAMVSHGQKETEGELGDFCVGCHSPIGTRTGQLPVTRNAASGLHEQPFGGIDRAASDGVSCLVCHSMDSVIADSNAEFTLAEDGVRRATIRDPAPTTAHESEHSGLHEGSHVCGTCHTVINPKGVALERTFIEWMQSQFNGAKECQDCHMPAYRGRAASGGKERTVHEHRFVGVDVSLLPEDEFPGYHELREATVALLQESAKLTVRHDAGAARLTVAIENLAGHALPSGATADRELWVEVMIRDATGRVVLESGTLDERGDLRVRHAERTTRPGTDPELQLFTQEMLHDPALEPGGGAGEPQLVDFLWEPNSERTTIIGVHETHEGGYSLAGLSPGRHTATVRLLFRSFPPHLLRKLEKVAGLDPAVQGRVPTVEMASETLDLSL
ncbi:MAG: ammonia-forming cytochrome c nitrite reductase subunit c552 [Deltaproteobacteria bacterium]|nr:ammonia-forming cytochrome c nitrite reductase subunit c552 [Deltaproteobacteria bacterium]